MNLYADRLINHNTYSIDQNNVIDYLISNRLLDNRSIVDDGLEIYDISRKNRNIKISTYVNSGLFLKQSNLHDIHSSIAIKRESLLYTLIQTEGEFAFLKDITPKIHNYDEKNNIMITDLIFGNTWNQYITLHPNMKIEIEVIASLAHAVAKYHQVFENAIINSDRLCFLPKTFVFKNLFVRPGPEIFVNLSQANMTLIKHVQNDLKASNTLEELYLSWNTNTIIHGDIKFDNIIVSVNNGNVVNVITDWEMASIGDPAWDIGSIFQEFIRSWLMRLPILGNEKPLLLLQNSEESYQNMQNAIRVFWNAYLETVRKSNREANDLLLKSVKFCAARLLQSVFEMLHSQNELNNVSVYMIQLSLNILGNPSNSAIHFFGIPFKIDI
ncbi:MAG: phosphotransferase family protein [Candidatus Nitrosocosmicus sp.]